MVHSRRGLPCPWRGLAEGGWRLGEGGARQGNVPSHDCNVVADEGAIVRGPGGIGGSGAHERIGLAIVVHAQLVRDLVRQSLAKGIGQCRAAGREGLVASGHSARERAGVDHARRGGCTHISVGIEIAGG